MKWVAISLLTLVLSCVSATAKAASGETVCGNEDLRASLNELTLPDCRAYEMVSPPYKEGYPMFAQSYSTNGETAILSSFADIAGSPGGTESVHEGAVYLGTRTTTGWSISPLNPSPSEFVGQIPVAVEANQDESLWKQHRPGESAFTHGLYVRSPAGVFSFVGPLDPPSEVTEEGSNALEGGGGTPVGSTSNYQNVVFSTFSHWPFDNTKQFVESLYEYSGTDNGQPILVGVSGAKGSTQLIGRCGTYLGGQSSAYNALSSDGETIFFTAESGCGMPAVTEIYARLHGSLKSLAEAQTVDVSASDCTVTCGEESGKNFEGAAEDGGRAFFTSTQKLTDGAVDGTASGNATAEGGGCASIGAGSGGCNLYEYDLSAAPGNRLSLVAGGEVLGVAGIAEDGKRIYFVSRSKLVAAGPQEEQPNLYVYDSTDGMTKFIATLGGQDGGDWLREFRRAAEVSGTEGRFLLFVSSALDSKSAVAQLYEYDALTGELVRVTKGEDGYNEDGNGVTLGIEPSSIKTTVERLGNGIDFKSGTNRLNISQDGKTVLFVTRGQLSPRATSAQQECRSLYEFRSAGAISEGSVHLVSDGRDVQLNKGALCGPQFQAIDEEGDNVLFTTADPLLPSDVDGVDRDVYDARVGGGFTVSPEEEESSCEAGLCEGPSSASPRAPVLRTGEQTAEAGVPSPVPATGKKSLTRSAKLAGALKVCKAKAKGQRVICERAARRRYGAKARPRSKSRRGRK